MPELFERFTLWLNTKQGKKLFRYSMVSVISTAVSFSVLLILFGVAHVWSEVPDTICANVVATFPSYWLNRSWAWGKSGRSHFVKEVLPFWVMSALGIAFSVVGAAIAHKIGVDHFAKHHVIRTALVLLANIVSFGIFWVAKLMLFNRLFHVAPLAEEIEEHIEEETEVSSDVQLH